MVRRLLFALAVLLVSPSLAGATTLSVGDPLDTTNNTYVTCSTSSAMKTIAQAFVDSEAQSPDQDEAILAALKANDCDLATSDTQLMVRDLPVFSERRKHADTFTTAFAAEIVDSHTEVWIVANTKDELKIKRPELTPGAPDTDEPSTDDEEASAEPEPEAPVHWLATAQTMWRDRKGLAHVAVGYSGETDSSDAASAQALDACKKESRGRKCTVIGPFSSGCLYITTGSSKKGVAYGNGVTPEAALKSCQKQGYKCQKPIGGCLE